MAKRPYGRSRRDLAEIAIREFEIHGFASTTVGQIAAAAGYSERTFFRQFAGKEDVVFFDLPDILSPLEALIGTPDPWPRVCDALIGNSTNWEAAGPHLAQSRTRLFHEDPALYRRFLEISTQWEDVLTRVFAEHDETVARMLACTTVAACRVAFRLWLEHPRVPLADHMRATLGVIEAGFPV
jgi:AcrR family transcriptional regulator